jgi:hypothetical protein
MTLFDRRTEERTATGRGHHAGPRTILLGIDEDGHEHVYLRRVDVIQVVDPDAGERVERVDLHALGRSVDDWMNFVDDQDAWDDRRLVDDPFGAMLDGVETGA